MFRLDSKPNNKRRRKQLLPRSNGRRKNMKSLDLLFQSSLKKACPQTTLMRRSQQQISEQASKAQKLRDLKETKDVGPLIILRKHKVKQEVSTI